jgi:hypothetical protein
MAKAFFGRFITSDGTRNGSDFIFFNAQKAKAEMIEIARGNCQESGSCEYYVTDDFSQIFYHGKVIKHNGKYSYLNLEK